MCVHERKGKMRERERERERKREREKERKRQSRVQYSTIQYRVEYMLDKII